MSTITHRFVDLANGQRLHVAQAGSGPLMLFLHGFPEASFMWNGALERFGRDRLAVAPDQRGYNLSSKPVGVANYRPKLLVEDILQLADALGHERFVLVAHDWGGAIAMGWATRHPEQVARIVLMNTAAFPVPATKSLPVLIKLARGPLGAFLVTRFNAFARGAATVAMTRRKLPRDVKAGLLAPYEGKGDRLATLRFAEDIPLSASDPAYAPLAEMEKKLSLFVGRPKLLAWGAKDFVFDLGIMREFEKRWPDADVTVYPDAGHYVLEDAGDLLVPRIVEWLQAHPIA